MSDILLVQINESRKTLLGNYFGKPSRKPPSRKMSINCARNTWAQKTINGDMYGIHLDPLYRNDRATALYVPNKDDEMPAPSWFGFLACPYYFPFLQQKFSQRCNSVSYMGKMGLAGATARCTL